MHPTLITNARTQFQPVQSPLAAPLKRIEHDAITNDYACWYGEQFICYARTQSEGEMKLHQHAMRVLTHRQVQR